MADYNLNRIRKLSVEAIRDAKTEGVASSFYGFTTARGFNLAPWGTRESERQLRAYYRHEYNWLGQAAISGLAKKVAGADWEIKGNRRVRYFQDVLRQADMGHGWSSFIMKLVTDFCTLDGGGYIEIVAPGNPLKAPTGPAVGIKVLDGLRCLPTGDPEYPVQYYSRRGELHLMHRTRVRQIVDMPMADESQPGYGLSATRRAISIIAQQIHMMRYVEGKLDDVPPPGIIAVSNATSGVWDAAVERYMSEQAMDDRPVWGRNMLVYSTDPSYALGIEHITFAQAPEGYSYQEYMNLHVNAWAAALGVDKQEIWELSGGNLGSGAQSQILHAKSQGRMVGYIYKELERAVNDILPESLEFAFKVRDPYEAQERAQTANQWATFAKAVEGFTSPEEIRRIVANQVEAYMDAVTDEDGQIVRYHDADVEPEPPTNPEEQVLQDQTPAPEDAAPVEEEQTADGQKAIQATRLDFEDAFEDLLAAGRSQGISKRAFERGLRNLVAEYGRKAYIDGLNDGAVAAMDEGDTAEFVRMMVSQNKYIKAFTADVYKGGVSDSMADLKPAMWYSGSVSPFYEAGRLSADRNGVYEFAGDDGVETCKDCQRLKGQRHRMTTWTKRRERPRIDRENFECGGWLCKHLLVRVREKPGAIKEAGG